MSLTKEDAYARTVFWSSHLDEHPVVMQSQCDHGDTWWCVTNWALCNCLTKNLCFTPTWSLWPQFTGTRGWKRGPADGIAGITPAGCEHTHSEHLTTQRKWVGTLPKISGSGIPLKSCRKIWWCCQSEIPFLTCQNITWDFSRTFAVSREHLRFLEMLKYQRRCERYQHISLYTFFYIRVSEQSWLLPWHQARWIRLNANMEANGTLFLDTYLSKQSMRIQQTGS